MRKIHIGFYQKNRMLCQPNQTSKESDIYVFTLKTSFFERFVYFLVFKIMEAKIEHINKLTFIGNRKYCFYT